MPTLWDAAAVRQESLEGRSAEDRLTQHSRRSCGSGLGDEVVVVCRVGSGRGAGDASEMTIRRLGYSRRCSESRRGEQREEDERVNWLFVRSFVRSFIH